MYNKLPRATARSQRPIRNLNLGMFIHAWQMSIVFFHASHSFTQSNSIVATNLEWIFVSIVTQNVCGAHKITCKIMLCLAFRYNASCHDRARALLTNIIP